MAEQTLSALMLDWYDTHKRVLPFRGSRDPYRVWVSEIMLQQTRTETVSGYFLRFMERFPTVSDLAAASEEDVLKMWEGLGYYSRARNLHKAAKIVVAEYGGAFPADAGALRALPGVGDYTAAAVASIAFDMPLPAMDGNLTRVFSRVMGVREDVGIPSVKRKLAELAQAQMPEKRAGEFNQALMDLGASVCVPGTPECEKCPLTALCSAYGEGDADMLPVKAAAKPPKVVELAVVIVTCGGRVLMMKRQEALLNGLWVFPLLEGAKTRADIQKSLKALGVKADFAARLGEARHVFTHRVWNMTVFHYVARTPDASTGEYLSAAEMLRRPLPTAVRYAKSEALRLLTPDIRPMQSGELEEAGRAYSESWREAHKTHCSEAFLREHDPERMAMTLLGHRDFGRQVYILAMAGQTAGIMVLDEQENELVSLYVRPVFQGCGLGKAAVAFAVNALDKERDMRVTVLCGNERALALYRSFGFDRAAEERVLDPAHDLRERVLLRAAASGQ